MPALKPIATQVVRRQLGDVGGAIGGAAEGVGAGVQTAAAGAGGAIETVANAPNAPISAGTDAAIEQGKNQAKAELSQWFADNWWAIVLPVLFLVGLVLGFCLYKRRKRAGKSTWCCGSSHKAERSNERQKPVDKGEGE